jgi:hypothetical protein
MARVHLYRTYRWIDKDPAIDAIRTVVQGEKLKANAVHEISGVATGTLEGWFSGGTRKPHNSTLTAVSSALGYVRHDHLNADGSVVVAFEKARDLNWGKEIAKQADFVLKYGTTKQKQIVKRKRAPKA